MTDSDQNILDASLLLESMAEGVFTLNSKGEITSWNPSMERISGYKPEEAIGKSCMLLNFSRCFSKSCPTGINKCEIFQLGRVDAKECFIRHKNGHDIPVVKSARLIKDNNGSVKGVVETLTDMTELENARLRAEEANLKLGEIHQSDNIIGKGHAIRQVFSAIQSAGASDAAILLQGESGTGKELVAGAIHYHSQRSDMPFAPITCSALSESLLESELFGHVKGAFTGAVRDRAGRFEKADGGTVFLDEIGEVSPFIQVKLLRVLQEREVERVGESIKRKVDIRIIAASNKDLYELVKKGDFREDLYYRLKVFPINLPPLRERKEDIPILISHFINIQNKKTGKQINGVLQPAMRMFMDYQWPGNVRELENAIEHAFVLCNGHRIDIFDLPVEIRRFGYQLKPEKTSPAAHHSGSIKQKLSREVLVETLTECGWNKAEVGRRVGLSRASIWKYMKKWDIPLKQHE